MPYLTRKGIPLCKEPGVYAITNKKNGKVYVGSALSIYGRMLSHRSSLRRGVHDNPRLQFSWNKHQERAFRFDVLETCSAGETIIREQHWIDALGAVNPDKGYNICPAAGYAMLGRNHTEESRAKMSAKRKGMDTSKATAAAALVTKGKARSLDVRTRIALGNKGKKRTEETKANIKANHWTKRPDASEIRKRIVSKNREMRLSRGH